MVTTTFAGFVAEQYGNGPEIAFLLGRNPDTQSDWNWFTSNSPALAGWTLYNVTDPELDTERRSCWRHTVKPTSRCIDSPNLSPRNRRRKS